jgi:hypothetical protein
MSILDNDIVAGSQRFFCGGANFGFDFRLLGKAERFETVVARNFPEDDDRRDLDVKEHRRSYPDPWPEDAYNIILDLHYDPNSGSPPTVTRVLEPF